MNRFQDTYPALGTETLVTVVGEISNSNAARLFEDIKGMVLAFERRFSRFIAESELNQLNHKAGKYVSVSLQMKDLIELSKEMYIVSNGLFNPLILPALQKAGYLGSWTDNVSVARNGTDYRSKKTAPATEIDIKGTKVKIPKDTAIDFGGIGKGYLLDVLSHKLEEYNLSGYWLSLGGDILASGSDLDRKGWNIGISSASGNAVIASYETYGSQLSLAASGITKRQGKKGELSWHHIIDPETNSPAATNILTATVVADSGYKADVFAKCLVIGGLSIAENLYEHKQLAAFLLQTEEAGSSLVISKGAFV